MIPRYSGVDPARSLWSRSARCYGHGWNPGGRSQKHAWDLQKTWAPWFSWQVNLHVLIHYTRWVFGANMKNIFPQVFIPRKSNLCWIGNTLQSFPHQSHALAACTGDISVCRSEPRGFLFCPIHRIKWFCQFLSCAFPQVNLLSLDVCCRLSQIDSFI